MYEFIKTEKGWLVFWGPPPKDRVRSSTPTVVPGERERGALLTPVASGAEEGAAASEFCLSD